MSRLPTTLCLITLVAGCASASNAGGGGGSPMIGQPAPDLSATDVASGAKFDLRTLRGKVVIVDFWASWCQPCRTSLPHHDALARRHGAELVAISVDDTADLARRFLQEVPLQGRVLWDEGKTAMSAAGVKAMPTALLLDRSGVIRGVFEGWDDTTAKREEAQLLSLLKGGP